MRRIFFVIAFFIICNISFAQNYKYKENFDNNENNWSLGKDVQTQRNIKNGVFSIENFANQKKFWSIWNTEKPITLDTLKNYRIVINASENSVYNDETKNIAIGIRFTVTNSVKENDKWINNTFYAFTVNKQGIVQIYKRNYPELELEKIGLPEKTNLDLSVPTDIIIIKKGNNFSFYILNHKVAEVEINDMVAFKDVGFFMLGKAKMNIDYLKIKELK